MEPLPDALVRRPMRTADLRDHGLTRRELEGPLWQPAGHGVRAWFGLDPTDPAVRTAAVAAAAPPGTVIGGWAALHHQGVRRLDGRFGPGGDQLQPVLVHVGPDGRSRPTQLLDVDRSTLSPADVLEHKGLLVVAPTPACVAIACRYGAEEGLVAADAAAAAGLTSQEALQDYVARRRRRRGIPQARLVAELVDSRAASPPESRFRYVWVVLAGLPKPCVNRTLVHADGGYTLGKPDLLDPEAGLVGEYDGSQHRALDQHTADNFREEGFERVNLVVSRATAQDLWPGRNSLVYRLRDAHLQGRCRDRSKDRWSLLHDH